MKFYECTNCHQMYIKINDQHKDMTCCDLPTTEIAVNTIPDEQYKHQPHVRKIGQFITISLKQDHPIVDIHHIDFICIETTQGFQYKEVAMNEPPKKDFVLAKHEELRHVYIHCTVHSLWKYDAQGNI